MKKIFVLSSRTLAFLLAIAIIPTIAFASPVTYTIGKDPGIPGFGASYLHDAQKDTGGGYYANGNVVGISGSLTIDLDALGNSSGSLTGSAGSGPGDLTGSWVININGGGKTSGTPFSENREELLHLNYTIFKDGDATPYNTGSFYFAENDFNGSSNPGPNSISESELILWGNNWINGPAYGLGNHQGPQLGIDLYGTGQPVPEPATVALLGIGLVGLAGTAVRRKRKERAVGKTK